MTDQPSGPTPEPNEYDACSSCGDPRPDHMPGECFGAKKLAAVESRLRDAEQQNRDLVTRVREQLERLSCLNQPYRAGKPCHYWPLDGFSRCDNCLLKGDILAALTEAVTGTAAARVTKRSGGPIRRGRAGR